MYLTHTESGWYVFYPVKVSDHPWRRWDKTEGLGAFRGDTKEEVCVCAVPCIN